ncbi:MAG: DUF2799 domain-containing protein [Moraxella sp.]|uniref:DUF2799 domain-containing protein n=1 Tax=Moraxella sp. TaxID=479 RepID=UPI0026DCF69D|nr:DUF2799 domain-containing protein [Moraxella sp.]MDO4450897.1 DUF2799 domain-containing protein [Moraxella sp.]
MKKSILLFLPILILSGCATTTTLKATECTHANWEHVGLNDGMHGASSQAILKHAKTCQGKSTPNHELWEAGRQKGLESYCTPNNAYNIGRLGRTLNGVCDDKDGKTLEELHRANMMGLQQYEMSERMNRFHYGYGGWLNPWFSPYHPYWW